MPVSEKLVECCSLYAHSQIKKEVASRVVRVEVRSPKVAEAEDTNLRSEVELWCAVLLR